MLSGKMTQRLYELSIVILQEHEQPGAHSWSTSKTNNWPQEDASCDTCDLARKTLDDLGYDCYTLYQMRDDNGLYPAYKQSKKAQRLTGIPR